MNSHTRGEKERKKEREKETEKDEREKAEKKSSKRKESKGKEGKGKEKRERKKERKNFSMCADTKEKYIYFTFLRVFYHKKTGNSCPTLQNKAF